MWKVKVVPKVPALERWYVITSTRDVGTGVVP